MNKWNELTEYLDKRMKYNDNKINAFINQIPINHNAILQLQIQNGELYILQCFMDELNESEAKQ